MARSVPDPALPGPASPRRRGLRAALAALLAGGVLPVVTADLAAAAPDPVLKHTEVQILDRAPLPGWTTFAGHTSTFVARTLEGVLVDEFGHDQSLFDPSRYTMSDEYRSDPADVHAAVLGDVDGDEANPEDLTPDQIDAVVASDTGVRVLGPQSAGYRDRAYTLLPSGGTTKGVAILPGASGNRPTIAVFTSIGVHLYRLNGTSLQLLNTLTGGLGSPAPVAPANLLNAYQRPSWDHYRHESPLPEDVVAVTGRDASGDLRGYLLRWDRSAQTFVTTPVDQMVVDLAPGAQVRAAAIRYDQNNTHLGATSIDPGYFMAILHRVPGQAAAVLTREVKTASKPDLQDRSSQVCPSDEPQAPASLDVEVLDLQPAGDNFFTDQFAFTAGCASLRTSNGVLDRLQVDLVTYSQQSRNPNDASVTVFDVLNSDVRQLDPGAPLLRPAVQVMYPCPASLVFQTPLQGQTWRCGPNHTSPNLWNRADTAVAAHVVTLGEDGRIRFAGRAWKAPKLCFTAEPGCPAETAVAGELHSANHHVIRGKELAEPPIPTPVMLRQKPERWTMTVEFDDRVGVPMEDERDVPPVPIAILAAPPTVAGAGQEVDPPEFARHRTAGSEQSLSTRHEAGYIYGADVEDSSGLMELEVTANLNEAFETGVSVSDSLSLGEYYEGRPDEHVIVYRTTYRRRVLGKVIETSTGMGAGDERVPMYLPAGSAVTARTLSSFKAAFPETYQLLKGPIDSTLPMVIGNPGSYLKSAQIDDYCIGSQDPGPFDELLSTPGFLQLNPFAKQVEHKPGPDVLVGEQQFANAGPGGSAISGATFAIDKEQSSSRLMEVNVGGSVELTLLGVKTGVQYNHTWAHEASSSFGEGVSFSVGVGSIPNPRLENEQYDWKPFLCKRQIGGAAGRLPVWVLNYAVDVYGGSGGLEPLGDITLDAPVHSTVVNATPGFSWSQDDGTIEKYELEIEAVGASDRRVVTDVATAADTVAGAHRSEVAAAWSELQQTNPLLPNQLYRWRVTATDFFGNEKVSPFEFFVTEGPPRDAQLTTSDPGPEAGEPITVTMTHTQAPGPLTYAFNFGDGTTANQASPSVQHTYAAPGVYVINGTVTSPLGTASASATVSVGPKATDDAYDAVEDTTLEVARNQGVLRNDVGAETAVLLVPPTDGEVDLALDGSFTYEPDANHCGDDAFVYGARGGASSRQATVRISVACVNDAPTGRDSGTTINEDTSFDVEAPGLLTVVEDVDGDPLTVSLVDDVDNGTLDLSSDGAFTYTPDPDWCGLDVFRFEASDGELSTGPLQVRIRVVCINDAPVANPDDPLTAVEDGSAKVKPLLNDTDVEGDELRAVLATPPQLGTVDLVSEDGGLPVGLHYTPEPDFCGSDSFGYRASDGQAESNEVTIEVTVTCVNDAPVAEPDTVQAVEDALGVVFDPLANDHDVDSPDLTIRPTGGAEHGELIAPKASSEWTYRPDRDFCGTDTIEYELTDGELTATGTVTIEVSCVNDAPVGVPDEVQVDEDGVVEVRPLDNDVDVDEGDVLAAVITSQPAHGTLHQEHPLARVIEYRPDPDHCGPDSFTYQADDGPLRSADTTVSIDVVCINDAPVLMPDPPVVIDEDGTVTVDPTANDTDVEGDALVPVIVDEPEHGTVDVGEDGTITYTPDRDHCGADSFSYEVSDGTTTSGPVEVPVTIACINDAPVAIDDPGDGDLYRIDQGAGPLVVGGAGVLANDHDVDGDPLTASVASGASHGTVVVNPDGTFAYTPAPSFYGVDSFTYQVSDGQGGTDTGEVRIRVRGRTTVVAAPVVLRLVGLRVYLTTFEAKVVDAGGAPVVGRTVDFELAGQRRCSAVTDSNGVARCTGQLVGSILALLTGGYTASFDGDDVYLASAGRGKLLAI